MFKKLASSLLLFSLFAACYADQPFAMIRNGYYIGMQFGYLDAHYSDTLDRYSASTGNDDAEGSAFAFHGIAGYNFNEIYGVELGVMQYQDSSDGSTTNTIRKASIDVLIVDVLATFHLKLNDSRSWVGTPKFGFALEQGSLMYQYNSFFHLSPPWGGGNVNETQDKFAVMPTAGVTFDHSFDSHIVMSFGYQYYFGGFATYNDPYHTDVSSIDYFSVGGTYKF